MSSAVGIPPLRRLLSRVGGGRAEGASVVFGRWKAQPDGSLGSPDYGIQWEGGTGLGNRVPWLQGLPPVLQGCSKHRDLYCTGFVHEKTSEKGKIVEE